MITSAVRVCLVREIVIHGPRAPHLIYLQPHYRSQANNWYRHEELSHSTKIMEQAHHASSSGPPYLGLGDCSNQTPLKQ
jgi:hypothetical protein